MCRSGFNFIPLSGRLSCEQATTCLQSGTLYFIVATSRGPVSRLHYGKAMQGSIMVGGFSLVSATTSAYPMSSWWPCKARPFDEKNNSMLLSFRQSPLIVVSKSRASNSHMRSK